MLNLQRAISSSESESSSDDSDGDTTTVIEKVTKNGHIDKKAKIESDTEKIAGKDGKNDPKKNTKDGNERAGSDSGKDISKKNQKVTSVKEMLKAQRDANVRGVNSNGSKSGKNSEASSSDSSSGSSSSDDEENDAGDNEMDSQEDDSPKISKSDAETNGISHKAPAIEAKLPDNLPADLLELINKVKEAAKLPQSKSNYFNMENSNILFK